MGRAKANAGAGAGDIGKTEHPLQAVVLADSFNNRLRPITLEKPKCLLPLAGVPMLEYTLEFLATSGVSEIFVFSSWKFEDIKNYIENSRWRYSSKPIVRTVSSKMVTNAGEALRELQQMNCVRSDPFVLVSGDTISNIRLDPIIEIFKQRRKKDKKVVMALTLKKISSANKHSELAPLEDDLLLAIDSDTKQILRYENDNASSKIMFHSGDTFKEHSQVEIRFDLLDCHIDICSQEMLAAIADNYDYKDLRRDYIHNEVQNKELGYKIFAHELNSPTAYAAKVQCFRTYAAISRDVLHRWLYPLVPDNNWTFGTDSTSFKVSYGNGFIYRENDVIVARSSSLSKSCILGAGCEIGSNSVIINSSLGRRCKIGEGVTIRDSIIFDDVEIGNDSVLNSCVVCGGSKIGSKVTVSRGAVLGYKVTIVDNVKVPEFARITVADDTASDDGFGFEDDEMEAESKLAEKNKTLPYVFGEGRLHSFSCVDEDDEEDADGKIYINGSGYVPVWAAKVINGMPGEASFQACRSALGIDELEKAKAERWKTFEDIQSDSEDEDEENDDVKFLNGIEEIMSNLTTDADNLTLEINCFKYAENRSFADCLLAMFPILFRAVDTDDSIDNTNKVTTAFKPILNTWAPTLTKFIGNEDAKLALLNILELYFLYGSKHAGRIGLDMYTNSVNCEFPEPTMPQFFKAAYPLILVEVLVLLDNESIDLPLAAWVENHNQPRPRDVLDLPLTQAVLASQLESDDEDEEESSEEESD
mmetsp:Transcript_16099/g.21152  ORF Transcript_16099/g.21152 Transcript_16099/m.21152 type:complete len:759 (+) Transcript_16099:202-2478(+)